MPVPRDLLSAVLIETLSLVTGSAEEGFAQRRPSNEVAVEIRVVIEAIADGVCPDLAPLRVLFAPTGFLQELSMANGWEARYLSLARRFDSLTG